PSGRSTSRPSKAGSPRAKPRPKCEIMSVWLSSRMLSVKAAPSVSQAWTSRPRFRATLICGGSNEHCCTQLASMPVSSPPRRTVRTNSPPGTPPRAASISMRGSPSTMPPPSFRVDQLGNHLLDFGVAALLELPPFALAVEDEDARHRPETQFLLPERRLLVEDDVVERGVDLAQELQRFGLHLGVVGVLVHADGDGG